MTANDMTNKQEKAKSMTSFQLLGAIRDCSKTAKIWKGYPEEGRYMDELAIYAQELKKRKA